MGWGRMARGGKGVAPLFPSFSTNIYLNLIHTPLKGMTSMIVITNTSKVFQFTLPQGE